MENTVFEIILFIFLEIVSILVAYKGVTLFLSYFKTKNKVNLIIGIIMLLGGVFYFIKHILELKIGM